jgi:hypothetical protein
MKKLNLIIIGIVIASLIIVIPTTAVTPEHAKGGNPFDELMELFQTLVDSINQLTSRIETLESDKVNWNEIESKPAGFADDVDNEGVTTNSTICDDGSSCTLDIIADGECRSIYICDDGDLCTIDYCDPSTSECKHELKSCDDGNLCTIDSCTPWTGECINTEISCDDEDLCTIDTCIPGTGECIHELKCNDGNLCTIDTCTPGTGECIYTAISCDDGNPRTLDRCVNGICWNQYPI